MRKIIPNFARLLRKVSRIFHGIISCSRKIWDTPQSQPNSRRIWLCGPSLRPSLSLRTALGADFSSPQSGHEKSGIIFLAIIAIISCAAPITFAQPSVSVQPDKEYDLGELEEGRIYYKDFNIINNGDSRLEIKKISVGCGCTTILRPKQPVVAAPGGIQKVEFSFNTEGMSGDVSRSIFIESNDPQGSGRFTVNLKAKVRRSKPLVIQRFESYAPLTVIFAGLLDGVNPCAFTVLIFFLSFLTFVGYKKRQLFILGSTFITAVFITYMLIGLGLFKFVQSLEAFAFLSRVVYIFVALLAVVLGIYSLYDWYIFRKTGSLEAIKLKLPEPVRKKIHKIVQGASRNKNKKMSGLVLSVFVSGVMVSLLESVCTGQTYVPTIAYVFKEASLRIKALTYLLLYNLMFILPLILIFISMIFGLRSEALSAGARKWMGLIKLLMALLFFLLGFLLFFVKGV